MDKKEIYKQLSAEFPKEALDKDESRNKSGRGKVLTTIRAQYVIERLNEVCGIDGWSTTSEFQEGASGVLCHLELHIHDIGKRPGCGFATIKSNVGDAYKGSRTDAISKAASWFGVGNSVFKGQVDPNTKELKPSNEPCKDNMAKAKFAKFLAENNVSFEAVEKKLGKKMIDLSVDDMDRVTKGIMQRVKG